ncbi:hypothetical protein HN51_000150 [Arachis hypogaea]|uniref:Uncharacterized protein LOC107489408 n=2 Tax=Arachis TaxID=3817 RepID=A0A6P4DJP2_ARADU|nr:uncharacterized protein LOC107489408 [Arachis duranensis]XP_025687980.1 probable serine/threonine-protein kinase DDB_G0282963 [Arachis hypogaea]XP_052108953.1 uncharacterized protein LOC107489408 [Arachis duranensis]RYR79939.1 hypothetical protein Ahy_A01g004733 [Arachis hypogaea]
MDDKYSGIWRSLREGEFEEEEVWSVMKERGDYYSGSALKRCMDTPSSPPLPVPRKLPSAARMIPRDHSNTSSSCASSSHEVNVLHQQSAPVNVPDWSTIYRTNKKQNNNNNNNNKNFCVSFDDEEENNDEEEIDDDEYDPKLPPHEIIARRLARTQISSFSVFEGVGRTLKGRDLSKVRNAVLTKTGFLESL